jgi:hypothetical protein
MHKSPLQPSRKLFARIMRRLGLEQQMHVLRRNLGLVAAALITFFLLCVVAFVGLRGVLAESGFGPYLSLMRSDPEIIARHWRPFVFVIFESAPGVSLAFCAASLGLFLLCVRFVVVGIEKLTSTGRSIRSLYSQNYYDH